MREAGTIYPSLWVVLALFLLPMGGCDYNRPDYNALAERMGELEETGTNPVTDERIDELRREIKRVDREVEDTLERVRDRGTYYKLLGLKLMDYSMWKDGAEAFGGALGVYPENARLHYYRGICLAQAGVNESDPVVGKSLLEQAEADYLRAIDLDGIYTSPLWGIAVLYVYELDRGREAGEYLDRLIRISPSHEKAKLLRAELYRASGDMTRALDLYLDLEKNARDREIKRQASERIATLGG